MNKDTDVRNKRLETSNKNNTESEETPHKATKRDANFYKTLQESLPKMDKYEAETYDNKTLNNLHTSESHQPYKRTTLSSTDSMVFQNDAPSSDVKIKIFSRPHWMAWNDQLQTLVYTDAKDAIVGGVYLDGRVRFLQYPHHETYWWPHDLAVDKHGQMYVTDVGNNRIAVLTSEGIVKGYIEDLNTPIALTVIPQTDLLAVGSQDGSITILQLLVN